MLRLSVQKAIEAAGVLLGCEHSQRISRLRLLKLLYIADRESLKKTGRPILWARAVAMDNGPLHAEVYDLIQGQHIEAPRWSQFFTNDGYIVERTEDPGRARLSRHEIEMLTAVSTEFAHCDDWDIVKHTHGFKEYQQHAEAGTPQGIPLTDIIDALGRSPDRESILQDAKDRSLAGALFGS